MKNNFLSFMGMRLRGRRMNDPEITRKSPGNHPVITPFSRLITSTLLLLFTFAIGNVWGANGDVLFSQDFNSATAVSQNLGAAAVDIDKESGNNIFGETYKNSQFTSLSAAKISNAKGGIAINSKVESNSVEYNYEKKFGFRSDDTKASFHLVKTTNFASTAPTALKVEMNMYYKQLSSGSNITASFAIGEGFSDKEKPAKSNIHSGFTIKGNSKATFCQFGTTTDLTGYATPMTQGKDVTMTWVINHSGDVLKYTDPNGEESSLANNAFDVWVGTTKNVSGAPATTGTKALQNLYIGDCDAKRKFEFYLDEIKVTDLTPCAAPSITTQPSGATLAIGDANPELSIEATNVASYAWKESSDGTSYDGSSTLASTASFTPEVNDAVQTKYYYCEVTSSCDGAAVVKSNIVTINVVGAITYYTVTLNPAGGTIADATGWTLNAGNYEKEVAEGTVLTLPTFTKTDRTFKTWRKAGSADVASPVTVDGDLSLTAIWTATIEQLIYSWEGAEGSAIETGGTASSSGSNNFINIEKGGYYCFQISGGASYDNYVEITLSGEEKVKTGDKIKYWGFYHKSSTANARPKMRDGNSPNAEIFNDGTNLPNLYDGTGKPAERTFTVPASINTNKVQITRSQTGSNTWISKLQIIREVQVEEGDLLTVTFDANGGSAIAPVVVASGQAVAKPADPTKAHNRFKEWQLAGSAYDFSTPVTVNITLVANWTPLYTVTYAANGGSGTMTDANEYAAGDEVTLLTNTFEAPDASHIWDSWAVTDASDNSVAVSEGKFAMPNSAATVTAQWALIADFDVKFFQGYGEPDVQIGTTQSISTGEYAVAPENPTRTGFAFLGWSTDGTEANIVDVATYSITAATNFTAMWKTVWTVTFDGAGDVNVEDGETVASPDSPTQAGKIFQGWYNGESKYDFSAAVTGNLALTSKWAAADPNHFYYTYNDDFHFDGVVYKTPDGKTKDPEAAEASNVELVTNPYTLFSGAEGITSIIATNGIYDYKKGAGTKHITAYLKLKADDATSNVVFTIASGYTAVLKLKMNGYSSNATISLKKGDDAVTPSGTQTGKAEDKNYGELTYSLTAGEYKLTTANKTLYISHIDLEATALPTYTVTYKAGEGTGADVEDANATEVATVPGTFTAPTGKVFNGWKDESDNDVEVGKIVTGNMTLTAQWIAVYAVTFNLNGQSGSIDPQDIKHGEKATKPADPSESGWIFGGWYKENTCTNAWDFDNDVVTEDTELFAKWTEDPCPDSEKKSIVKVVLTNASDGTVTGYNNDEYAGDAVIGGLSSTQTAEVDASHDGTETGYKLNNGGSAIVFATLAKGTFQEGDKVVITITKQQDAYKIGGVAQPILDIYYGTNKDDATFLTTIENVTAAGTYTYRLTAADITAIGDKKGIGVFRPSSGRTQNPYIYSVEIQGCRSWAVFHTLTFKNIDGTATIAAEPLEEGAAASTVAPAAPKITLKRFLGWAEAIDGTPVDLTTYTITEDKILYAVYEDIVCPTSGTVYKFEIKDELPSENLPTSTNKDMSSYITATGDGYLTYTATANNKATINSDGTIQMKDASAAYLKVELECALAAGDQIRAHITGSPMRVQVAATYDSDKDLILAKDDYTFVDITSAMEGKQVLYITRSTNGNSNIADFEIYRRPALTGVTMDDMIVRVNAVANPEMTLTPSNDAIVTAQAWSIVSGSDKITIDPATGAVTGVAAGDAVIKVVLNEDENFSATATVHVVNDYTRQDVTGSMEWNWANTGPLSGVAAQENNNVIETLLANIGTMPNNADFRSDMLVTTCQHAYRKNTGNGCWQGTEIKFYTTVPGAVKVNYMGTGGSDEVTLSINNWSNPYTGSWADSKTIVVPAGWVTISASESNKLRIKTITFTAAADLDPAEVHDEAYYYGGYDRNVTEGRYGTICLPNGGVMVGAELYEVAYFGETSQKVFLDNIINGEMEAGRPYIFLPKEGTTQLAVFYTDEAHALQGDHNGLIGFIGASEDEYFDIPAGEGNYILQNNYYREVPTGAWARIKSNRAYIKLSAIDPHESALAPGRRRISMSVYSEQVATGVENTGFESEAPRKVLINGELFILRGEKMYDAKGQLVK